MTLFLIFIWILVCGFVLWSVVSMVWRKDHRKLLKRRAIAGFVVGVGVLAGIGFSFDRDAKMAGFASMEDQSRANKAGIADAAIWADIKKADEIVRVQRAADEAEKTRLVEAERQAKADEDAKTAALAAEAQRRKDEEESKAKDVACRADIQCWGEEGWAAATARCPNEIEKLAKWDFEWTDSWSETKLSHYRWKSQKDGIVTYIGDKLKMQNGFGAWKHVRYTCDFDPVTKTVLDVSAL
ncbi:hypothetical protein [Agrobacterium sp. S7/73]|uniref:hypothetical protein n=1 Tax=Agrobacterium sp. S7/73 TaxID=2820002 RepID=UPI001C5BCFC5|nr:hypothetical protein [Agrobacterium sp. S7/73]QXZ71883.1 hypothetical protein J5276_12395 [Agrobacterium sp. S7/73]QXZ74671.1 hypothetical protein J5276_19010 [Agrobacterium sp. S7/73]